jgi:multidrug efflux pump
MRRALGTAVFAGMLGVTLFGLFLTPVFFVVLRGLSERRAAQGVMHGRAAAAPAPIADH